MILFYISLIMAFILAGVIYIARKFEANGKNETKADYLQGVIDDENEVRKIRDNLYNNSNYVKRVREKFTR